MDLSWLKRHKEEAQKLIWEFSAEDFHKTVLMEWQSTPGIREIWMATPILIDGNNFTDMAWVRTQNKEDLQAALRATDDATLIKVVSVWNAHASERQSGEGDETFAHIWAEDLKLVERVADIVDGEEDE